MDEIIIEYNMLKRIIALFVSLIIFIFGIELIILNNFFTIFFGIILILLSLLKLFDFLLFKKIIINDELVIKEWYIFGKLKISFNELTFSHVRRIWTTNIFFKNNNFSFIKNLAMGTELFPINSISDTLKEIKSILINKKIIKGDEHEWNN